MRHIIYEQASKYPIAILIKDSSLNKDSIYKYYIKPLEEYGITSKDVMVLSLDYQDNNKAPVSLIKEYLQELLPILEDFSVQLLYVADGNYFKPMTKSKKVDPFYGYAMDCVIPGYEDIKIFAGVPYKNLFFNPDLANKLNITLRALGTYWLGDYQDPGQNIIHNAYYPKKLEDIVLALDSLHNHDILVCDIETFGLKAHTCGIGTIAFAWNQHEGISFPVDYKPLEPSVNGLYGKQYISDFSKFVRKYLQEFFLTYEGKIIYHGVTFDAKILAYQLFMDADPLNYKAQLDAVELMTKKFHCTKILTYLATNNCTKNTLDLKTNAQEFAGNWAQDNIKDICRIPLSQLLEYNLVDCLSTWFVFDKYMPRVIEDQQLHIYETLFQPAVEIIINAELNGMPMVDEHIKKYDQELDEVIQECHRILDKSPLIKRFNITLQTIAFEKRKAAVKKEVFFEEMADIKFNPGSPLQVQKLLYEDWGLDILERTKKGAPAVGAKILEAHLAIYKRQNFKPSDLGYERQQILETLIDLAQAAKIKNTFFKAFKEGLLRADGMRYLCGNFNLTGTKSGRLSSSDPNMQNLPSTGTKYAKMVKRCFGAPSGWLMCGVDFDSLEDKISALTTKDTNKLKVYIEGFDGHSLRALSYFPDRITGIDPTSVESVNSIADLFPNERQDSKAPTFALTYDGTWLALVQQCGFTPEEAQDIERKYHELYKESDEWKTQKMLEASEKGYVEVAFGLRLRTPIMGKTTLNRSYTPYEAQKEARTAGNALGQSYCMLNNRAAIEFMNRVKASPYRLDVKLIGLIHDAIYLIIKDNIEVIHWVNKNLTECLAWQELPEIQHDIVKLSGSLDIFFPTWADKIPIPPTATKKDILAIADKV